LSPPYYSNSLNSDLIWSFNDGDRAQYDLFDVRYVIVPSDFTVPSFYEPMQTAGRWALYRVPTTGIAYYVSIAERRAAPTQRALFDGNTTWFQSADPATRRFIRWDYMEPLGSSQPSDGCPGGGRTDFEIDEPGSVQLVVTCSSAATLALKMTYHPNWHVVVDGAPVETFMLSPSYIGIDLPAGTHQVTATYEPTPSKGPLLAIGVAALFVAVVFRRRLDLPAIWVSRRRWRRRSRRPDGAD
jgi:hypothetical protein